MVPIYCLCSWISLKFFKLSIYFDTVRDCYEGQRTPAHTFMYLM